MMMKTFSFCLFLAGWFISLIESTPVFPGLQLIYFIFSQFFPNFSGLICSSFFLVFLVFFYFFTREIPTPVSQSEDLFVSFISQKGQGAGVAAQIFSTRNLV